MSWGFLVRRFFQRLWQRLTGADYYVICRRCGRDAGLFVVYPDSDWYAITGTEHPLCWGCFGKAADRYAEKRCGAEPVMCILIPDCHERRAILRWVRRYEQRRRRGSAIFGGR